METIKRQKKQKQTIKGAWKHPQICNLVLEKIKENVIHENASQGKLMSSMNKGIIQFVSYCFGLKGTNTIISFKCMNLKPW